MTSKLMDFGLSRIGDFEKTKTRHVGTGVYMAPEITKSGKYDYKVDIFSFGILMSVIVNENVLVYENYYPSIQFKVSSNENFRPTIKEEKLGNNKWLGELMKNCWNHFPQNRPTIDEVFLTLEGERKKQEKEI